MLKDNGCNVEVQVNRLKRQTGWIHDWVGWTFKDASAGLSDAAAVGLFPTMHNSR